MSLPSSVQSTVHAFIAVEAESATGRSVRLGAFASLWWLATGATEASTSWRFVPASWGPWEFIVLCPRWARWVSPPVQRKGGCRPLRVAWWMPPRLALSPCRYRQHRVTCPWAVGRRQTSCPWASLICGPKTVYLPCSRAGRQRDCTAPCGQGGRIGRGGGVPRCWGPKSLVRRYAPARLV